MQIYGDVFGKFKELRSSPFHVEYINSVKQYYENQLKEEVPQIYYSDFNEFFESGSRKIYSEKYYNPRKRLAAASILYLFYGDEKYLKNICDMIWIICSEITWAVPAHLADVDPKDYRHHIDLMAAETAFLLAEVRYIFEDVLPERIRITVKTEIEDRIFNPFEHREFMWETKTNNWAAVCSGTVGMAYMLIDPERFYKVKDRLNNAMQYFLKSYGDDGCCLEGSGYWGYGFGYYIYYADMLYRFTDGKTDIRHSEKLDNIALYLQKVVLRENIMVSFSDSRRKLDLTNAGLLCYLKNNYAGVEIPDILCNNFNGIEGRFSDSLRKFLWWDPDCFNIHEEKKEQIIYMEDAQWYIVKKKVYSFAAKSGNNDEPHNHNDVGSFIFATDSGQCLADLGSMEYNKDTFTQKRYTFFQNSSLGHSLPIIDGREQLAGFDRYGTPLKADKNEFSMQINKAYGDDRPGITSRF